MALSPPSAARIRLALALASPFGATLGATSAAAQLSEGRSFSIVAEPAKVGLGDSVTVRFRLSLNERDLLTDTVPRPVDELPEGVRILSVGKLSRGADRVFTGTAVLAFYRPGKRVVPAFGVPWVQVVTGHRGVVAHEAGEVEVTAILPAGNPPLRDIREPNAPRSLGVLWGLLGAGLVAVLAWLATRRRVAQVVEPVPAEAALEEPPAPPDPYTAALARLSAIEAERWAAQGDVARHYEAVADALRDYLEEADGIPARERTTTELLWSLPPRLGEGGLRRRVQDVLGDADLVKFARQRPPEDEAAGYTDQARDLLGRWHRAPRVIEEHDAAR